MGASGGGIGIRRVSASAFTCILIYLPIYFALVSLVTQYGFADCSSDSIELPSRGEGLVN